jgi:hypothetical protein
VWEAALPAMWSHPDSHTSRKGHNNGIKMGDHKRSILQISRLYNRTHFMNAKSKEEQENSD